FALDAGDRHERGALTPREGLTDRGDRLHGSIVRERPRRIAAGPLAQVPAGALLAVAADAEGARVHVLREVEDERDDDGPHQPVDLAALATHGLDERIGDKARANAVRD